MTLDTHWQAFAPAADLLGLSRGNRRRRRRRRSVGRPGRRIVVLRRADAFAEGLARITPSGGEAIELPAESVAASAFGRPRRPAPVNGTGC